MTKYEPLKRYLFGCHEQEAPFTFDDIEGLGIDLPPSARAHAPWWANETSGGHVQAKAWMEAGWRTSKVDVAREKVVFVREAPTRSEKPGKTDVDLGTLSLAGAKLIADYTAEANGDASTAIARAIHEAAMARRKRVIDELAKHAIKMPAGAQSAVDMIREDRDRDDR